MSLRRDKPIATKRALGTLRRVALSIVAGGGQENRTLRRVVNNVKKVTKRSLEDQHAQGVSKRVVPTGAGTVTTIVHNLGYKPTKFRLDKMKGAAVDHYVVAADERTAKISFSGAATADFWIY